MLLISPHPDMAVVSSGSAVADDAVKVAVVESVVVVDTAVVFSGFAAAGDAVNAIVVVVAAVAVLQFISSDLSSQSTSPSHLQLW